MMEFSHSHVGEPCNASPTKSQWTRSADLYMFTVCPHFGVLNPQSSPQVPVAPANVPRTIWEQSKPVLCIVCTNDAKSLCFVSLNEPGVPRK